MNKCTFINFMQALKPWLNDHYIGKARLDDKGNFILMFVDGGQKVYKIDDCSAEQLRDAVELIKRNGVPVST